VIDGESEDRDCDQVIRARYRLSEKADSTGR